MTTTLTILADNKKKKKIKLQIVSLGFGVTAWAYHT